MERRALQEKWSQWRWEECLATSGSEVMDGWEPWWGIGDWTQVLCKCALSLRCNEEKMIGVTCSKLKFIIFWQRCHSRTLKCISLQNIASYQCCRTVSVAMEVTSCLVPVNPAGAYHILSCYFWTLLNWSAGAKFSSSRGSLQNVIIWWARWCTPSIPGLERQRLPYLCEFGASLVYVMSSRTARTT